MRLIEWVMTCLSGFANMVAVRCIFLFEPSQAVSRLFEYLKSPGIMHISFLSIHTPYPGPGERPYVYTLQNPLFLQIQINPLGHDIPLAVLHLDDAIFSDFPVPLLLLDLFPQIHRVLNARDLAEQT